MTIFRPTKRAPWTALALLSALLAPAPAQAATPDWDVIVVGAGLAGLAAADALPELRVLVLERAATPGGRARTRTRHGVTYELGALVPPSPEQIPLLQDLPTLQSPGRLGVALGGKVFFGGRLDRLSASLPAGTGTELEAFGAGRITDHRSLSPTARSILESAAALFSLSSLDETPTAVARRSLRGLPGVALAGGYAALVETLSWHLGDRLRTQAEVARVIPEARGVRVRWRRGGWEHESLARAVIIATEAPAVTGLMDGLSPDAAAGLAAVRGAAGLTVALGIRDLAWPPFTAIYIPGPGAHTILRHPGPAQGAVTVLYVYYGDLATRDLSTRPDGAVLADALRVTRGLGLAPIPDDAIVFQDLQRWDYALPGLVDGARRPPWAARARASECVILAGDHVGAPGVDGGGAAAAIKSGRAAAAAVRELLHPQP